MRRRLRISADGFLDLSDRRRVKTPGVSVPDVEPTGEAEALSFLLSHAFPGHRRVVRPLTVHHRRRIRLAMWATSVSERMALVDRVWRQVTEPVPPPANGKPELLQVVHYGDVWAYPLYLDGNVTRVLPEGGLPAAELPVEQPVELDLRSA